MVTRNKPRLLQDEILLEVGEEIQLKIGRPLGSSIGECEHGTISFRLTEGMVPPLKKCLLIQPSSSSNS
jgi:hypothetical protein